jgi:mono/diheme cytochrome c family protein
MWKPTLTYLKDLPTAMCDLDKTIKSGASHMIRFGNLVPMGAIVAAGLAGSSAFAQDGDRVQGLALARQVCSECHTIDRSQTPSPNPASPRFEVIAKTPGMTAAALSVALLTPHRTMPNILLNPEELRNIVAYVLSLQ